MIMRPVVGICFLSIFAVACSPGGAITGAAKGLTKASSASRGLARASRTASEASMFHATQEVSSLARSGELLFVPNREVALAPYVRRAPNSVLDSSYLSIDTAPKLAYAPELRNTNISNVSSVSTSIREAQPKILTEIKTAGIKLTFDQADAIIKDNLAKSMQSLAEMPDSGIKFEILTGKLTIERSKSFKKVTIAIGEVNIYKISAYVAGTVMACELFNDNQSKKNIARYTDCVSKAVNKIKMLVTEELKKAS